jgi:hypothetical protein
MAMEVTDTPHATFGLHGTLPLMEQGNRYILTCQDHLSKYLEAIAIPNQEAVTITRALVDNLITMFGLPGSVPNQEAVTIARTLVDNVITVFGSPGSVPNQEAVTKARALLTM